MFQSVSMIKREQLLFEIYPIRYRSEYQPSTTLRVDGIIICHCPK